MPVRRACSRLRRKARALPVVLLSGVFMLLMGGLPATATAAPATGAQGFPVEANLETNGGVNREPAGVTATTSIGDLPDTVAGAGCPTNKIGFAPPVSSGTDVDPLDLYLLHDLGEHADGLPYESTQAATDPDRGPPVA